jgi:hypothetical protein
VLNPTYSDLEKLDGFVDGGLKEGTDELLVTWHGPLNDEAKAIIAVGEARGLKANVVFVPHTGQEMSDAVDALDDAFQKADIDVPFFSIKSDYQTIEIAGPELTDPAVSSRVGDVLAALPDVDVTILPWDSAEFTPTFY